MISELVNDVMVIESVLIAMDEGASDEKRAAIYSLEKMMHEKQAVIDAFEKAFAEECSRMSLNGMPVSQLLWTRLVS